MSDTNICSVKKCSLEKHEDYSECVLHCPKEKAQKDYHMSEDELVEFRRQLVILIVENEFNNDKMKDIDIELVYKYFGLGQTMKKVPNTLEKTIKDVLQKSTIVFDHISFPVRKERDAWDYIPILNLMGNIHFNYCKFYMGSLDLKETKCFFQDCEFFVNWSLYDYHLLKNQSNVLYQMCTFYQGTSAAGREVHDERLSLTNSQFADCNFGKELVLEYVDVKAPLFNNGDYFEGSAKYLKVYHCTFEEESRFILNQYCIEIVNMQSSIFQDKFEFKNNCIKEFVLDNCNFKNISDFYGTRFENFNAAKAIFDNFTGFEECKFGKENDVVKKELVAKFQYVTFLNTISFRNTYFYDGLDITHANFSSQPNFLNADIDPVFTDRETFRSIKHSFDSIGNYLDANKFFAQEMKKYKDELNTNGGRTQEKILFWFNEFISDFGQDYWKPIKLLLLSAVVFFLIYLGDKYSILKFMSPGLSSFFDPICFYANEFAMSMMPFKKMLAEGMEFTSLIFYLWYSVLIWQIVVAVKRHTRR